MFERRVLLGHKIFSKILHLQKSCNMSVRQLNIDNENPTHSYINRNFGDFREGSNDIPNPGGNKAVITQASFFADYGVSKKFTASLLVPYVKVVPGIRWQASRKLSAQLRFALPVYEDWNGRRETNVGQVAPDVTTMVTLTYNIGQIN